jgi:hypothetical protein
MKTPDEIKKGLRRFATELDDIVAFCNVEETAGLLEEARNRMFEAANCIEEMDSDLSAWGDVASSPGAVEDMARENYMLTERLAQVERERDAAVADLTDSKECDYCKYKDLFPACGEKSCYSCDKECPCSWCSKAGDGFKWRGVCEENTKEEN